jgi:hypothetical protein
MCKLAYYAIGGLAVVLAMDVVATPVTQSADTQVSVNRAGKGDRLVAARTGNNAVITSVEVVGIRDAAVVYRDRDGRVLYQSDPLTNATVVGKDVMLPDVTIRSDGQSNVRPVLVENPPQPKDSPQAKDVPQGKDTKSPKIPVGCDAAFSPLAVAGKSNFAARCLAGIEPSFVTAMALPLHIE